MRKPLAEFIGTFTLVLIGCGSAVIAGADIGLTGISFAFGLALIGAAYGIGPISGCHINPAVTLGVVTSGRMSLPEAGGYIIAQCAGAIAGGLAHHVRNLGCDFVDQDSIFNWHWSHPRGLRPERARF